MKIAIHHREDSFSEHWIEFCERNDIEFKIIDSYSDTIINDIKGCDIFMWNWSHWHNRDVLFARQLLFSIERLGIIVYPNINSCLLYDDKVGQKYLSESLNLPLVRSYTFYSKDTAINWINQTSFPKVFKQRGGAGAINVKLIKSRSQAKMLVNKAFGRGFATLDRKAILKDRYKKLSQKKDFYSFIEFCKGFYRIFYTKQHERERPRDKNYIYFQDFVPNCTFDTRVVVIGNRAFAMKRYTRKGDFRASGSELSEYNPAKINNDCVKLAFEINKKLKMQSVAFDFVENAGEILLIEYSYIWAKTSFGKHPGYWNDKMEWIEEHFCPADFIIEDLIIKYKSEIN